MSYSLQRPKLFRTNSMGECLWLGVFVIAGNGILHALSRVLRRMARRDAHLLRAMSYAFADVFCAINRMAAGDIVRHIFTAVSNVLAALSISRFEIGTGL